ncbi:MAG TPA: fibronectin type III domain-containing protein, partial [Polyangia bacterium]|nr:fibronectin type III domain-containing protein [Polyangia bacterium]
MGLTVGCGDNVPATTGTGGASGVAGSGGSSGGAGGATGGVGGAGASTDGGTGGVAGGAGGAGGSAAGAGGSAAGAGGSSAGAGGSSAGAGGSSAGAGGSAAGAGGSSAGAGGSAAGAGGSAAGAGGSAAGAGGSAAGAGGSAAGAGGSAAGAGGSAAGAGGSAPPCYTTAFTAPTSGATLTVTDDTDHTCANGFQYTVTITSTAPDGTDVSLYDGSSLLKTVQVGGGAASFAVQLATGGTAQQLSIQYPSAQTCNVTENVTVSCPNSPPTCSISAPVISATHPDLNGVPTPQGDRSSSAGSPYQATFVVNTNAEDGQTVTLAVNSDATNPATPVDGTPSATVSGGSATFGLPLSPDGKYDVVATCTNANGITGTSTKSSYTVDTTAPDLTINGPTAGQFIPPASLTNGQFQVCAQTDSPDAVGSQLVAGQQNLCVTLGSSATPSCVAVAAVNTSTCVPITCQGGAPFGLTITLTDGAGNPTTQTLSGVSCASTLPSVQIIAPASDAPLFTDPSKHILATNAPTGVKDEDPAIGAQADVVACSDTAGTATLLVGHKGDASLVQLGTSVTTAAVAADNCPSGLGFVAHFTGVTLPESNENADGTLAAATELAVTVTSAANVADVGTSQPDDVWVDSTPPNLALLSPVSLCGSFTQSAATVTEDVVYTADDKLVVADLTNNGVTTTYDSPAFVNGVATFGSVAFAEGQNALVATESDPAGNATVLATCTVTIGAAPVVTFTTPTAGALLCPSGDATVGCIDDINTGTAGWQGTLTVTVMASGVPVSGSVVTFTDGATTFGTATTDVGGTATLTPVTVAEGTQTIVATTDNVPSAGVGSGSVTVKVDTTPPNAPTNLTALVLDRRKTSMQLTWTAPSDSGGGNVSGYQVRYAKTPIVTATDFNAAP